MICEQKEKEKKRKEKGDAAINFWFQVPAYWHSLTPL